MTPLDAVERAAVGGALITTVIPTYNRSALVRRAIESVTRQTFGRLRICVYDNASEDDTRDVVAALALRDSRIVYYRHPENLGSLPNFRFALQRVDTPYFSVLADDDVLLPEFYAASLEQLARHPEAHFSIGVTLQMDARGVLYRANAFDLPAGFYRAPEGLRLMLRTYAPQWTGMLFSRHVLAAAGEIDPRVPVLDLDFQFRAAALCNCVLFHTPVAVFNTHSGSTSYRLRHHLVWPGWQYLTEKLITDERIPLEMRREAERLLGRRIRHLLVRMGWEALAVRDIQDAVTIAGILDTEFGLRKEARLLRFAAAAARRPVGAQQAIRGLYVLRALWRRVASRRMQRQFAGYAQHLASS